jgi:uncharacterized protein YcaQ
MTEQELLERRAEIWQVNGNPIRTIENARSFIDRVGFCLMYPVRLLPLVPSFFGAYAGTAEGLPDARHAFADPRTQPATELMVRLLRERHAYEVNLLPESSLLASAAFFPFVYALIGDRNPKAPPRFKAQSAKVSPLEAKVFEAIQKHGPLSKGQLRDLVGRELTTAALDRALNELWSILKITRVDYREQGGAYWDVLYRWSQQAVMDGIRFSAAEAISALIGKYLEAVVAASHEDIEDFFSYLVSRSKVREAVNALLAARELTFVSMGNKNLIHLPSIAEERERATAKNQNITTETRHGGQVGRRRDTRRKLP